MAGDHEQDTHTHHRVRGQLASIDSLYIPWAFQRLGRGCQARQQVPLPAEPLALTIIYFLKANHLRKKIIKIK